MLFTYKYPRPMVTTDIIVTKKVNNVTKILLIKRLNDPYKDSWALPGGFVDQDEELSHAALRELAEETGITGVELLQFRAYGDATRDPRGHCVSIVYHGVAPQNITPKAGDDAKSLAWFNITDLPALAFDHHKIITQAISMLKL